MIRAVACLALLVLALPVPAADPFDPADRTRALAGLIEEETIALVRIDLARTDLDGLEKTLAALVPSQKNDVTDLAGRMKAFQQACRKAGGSEVVAVFSSEELPEISFVSIPLKDGADVKALSALLERHLPAGCVVQKRGGSLFAGPRQAIERQAKGKPSARPELSEAVKAAGDTAVQVLLLPTAHHRRVIDAAGRVPLPEGSVRVLTRGVRWAALGLDVGAKPGAVLTMQSADAAAAKKLADLIATSVDRAGKMAVLGEDRPLKDLFRKDFEAATTALKPKVAGSRVTLQVSEPDAVRALAALADNLLDRTRGLERSGEQMRKIVLAVVMYSDATGTLPAHAIYSKDGKPLLSWRVSLLPYLGEEALYKEFKLDEPWDSPHNKKLIARIPEVYRSPKIRDTRPGLTTYLAPINKDFVFTGTKELLRFPKDIPDGTANTGVVVDVSDETGVVWTKPEDLVVDRKDPWKGMLGHYPAFVLVGTADGGGPLRLARTVKAETLWALFTRAGGEKLHLER
jgi:hypothetical protein